MAVTHEQAGQPARCPSCRTQFTVPPPPAARAMAAASGHTVTMQQRAADYLDTLMRKGRAVGVLDDIRNMDFKAEILPLSHHTVALLRNDFVFWSVTLLGVVPLLLGTLTETESQLTGMCLFFAAIWGVVFKKFVVEDEGSWGPPIAALLFSGLIGIPVLLLVYRVMPDFFLNLHANPNKLLSLLGYIFQVGGCEELCKVVPVAAYILWQRRAARPLTIILVGVFSGMGFAAFENLSYAGRSVVETLRLVNLAGVAGLQEGVLSAMVTVLLRCMSCVFGHAMYSGIFAYFLALGWVTQRRVRALAVVGLAVAATVHGLYDWFWGVQPTLPALITAVGFVLFYAYLTKLRLIMASTEAKFQ